MFLTHPQFKEPLPPALYGPNKEGHRAVILSTQLPWFLFTFGGAHQEGSVTQTVAVAFEATLAQIVEAVEPERRLAAYFVARSPDRTGWSLWKVQELWKAAPEEAEATGPLLFKLEGADLCCDAFMTSHPGRDGRTIVFRAPSSS